MDIEKLVAGLKEKGLNDDEVKAELSKIKADIDAYLNTSENPEEKNKEVKDEVESDEDKRKRIFGI